MLENVKLHSLMPLLLLLMVLLSPSLSSSLLLIIISTFIIVIAAIIIIIITTAVAEPASVGFEILVPVCVGGMLYANPTSRHNLSCWGKSLFVCFDHFVFVWLVF